MSAEQQPVEQMTGEQLLKAAREEKDFNKAVKLAGKALEVMVAKHSQLAPECANFYFVYGDILLNQCATDKEVFGSALTRVQEAGKGQVQDAQEEEEEEEEQTKPETEEQGEKETPKEGEVEGETQNNAEEPDDLEVAWELLDTARVIYSKMEQTEKVQSATWEVLKRLGDLSCESDSFDNALGDYAKALELIVKVAPAHDDRVATSHINMAVCHLFKQDRIPARQKYMDAAHALHSQLQHLLGDVHDAFVSTPPPRPVEQEEEEEEEEEEGKQEEEEEPTERVARVVDGDKLKEWSAKSSDNKVAAGRVQEVVDILDDVDSRIADLSKKVEDAVTEETQRMVHSVHEMLNTLASAMESGEGEGMEEEEEEEVVKLGTFGAAAGETEAAGKRKLEEKEQEQEEQPKSKKAKVDTTSTIDEEKEAVSV